MKVSPRTRWRWTEPVVLAIVSIVGLICALLSDGVAELWGDLMLATPLLAAIRHLARVHPKQESR
jgi:hypothetical protein